MNNSTDIHINFENKKQSIEQLSKFLFQKQDIIQEKIKNEKILERINSFNKKYSKLKNIIRFCIPVIGKCNSGKSTFLNYLLHQREILEMKADISTRFICIIRHDPTLSSPKIYKAKFEVRDTIFENDNDKDLYNFIEDEEIESNEEIKNIIIKKNEELKYHSNNNNDYFLIMKINIPFFNEPDLAPYANYFEFMDIPGLNESNIIEKDNFFLNRLFPYFINNIKFCFFVFDTEQYHGNDAIKVFNNTLSLFEEEKEIICKNSIYIFNKIDKPENKKLAIQNFESYLKETLKIDDKIDYIPCSSDLLLQNSFKFENYLNYLESILNNIPSDNKTNINTYIEENLYTDFGIKVEENLDDDFCPNDYQKNEYKKFEEKIKNSNRINISDYFYYKNFFRQNIKKSTPKDIELKIKTKLLNLFKETIDSYINFNEFENLMEEILTNLGIESEKIEDIKLNIKSRKIISLKKNPISIYNSFDVVMKKIISLKRYEYFDKMIEECSAYENFIKKEIKIRIPTLGCYSCGKSSLINNLIGYELLPVNTEVSTNIGIVINDTQSIDDICLRKTFLKKTENLIEDYYYFNDHKDIIYSKLDNMKEIISLMNNVYLYEDKVVDEFITFIKFIENNNSFVKVVELLNDILLYKDISYLNKFENFYNKLNKNDKETILETYEKIKLYLSSIIDSKLMNKRNKYLRNSANKNEENSFLRLSIPIKVFEELKLTEAEKNQIELIDFPGLNSENNIFDTKIINPLIRFSNGFFFITKSSINERDTSEIINTIIPKIINRKMIDFSFNTLLFVLTHCEELNNLNIEE